MNPQSPEQETAPSSKHLLFHTTTTNTSNTSATTTTCKGSSLIAMLGRNYIPTESYQQRTGDAWLWAARHNTTFWISHDTCPTQSNTTFAYNRIRYAIVFNHRQGSLGMLELMAPMRAKASPIVFVMSIKYRMVQEPNRNRKPEPSKLFFQEKKSEASKPSKPEF